MNQMQIFKNSEFGELNILVEDGRELFPATECARALGYSNPYDAISKHCRASLAKREVWVTTGTKSDGTPATRLTEISYITESDLLRLITHSRLDLATKFEAWVFEEVLPSIRRHGAYITKETVENMLGSPDFAIRLLEEIKTERCKSEELRQQIEKDKPLVTTAKAIEAAPTSILIRQFVKILHQNGIQTGEKRFFQWLRDNGYLIKSGQAKNCPTQRAMEMGLFDASERTVHYNDSEHIQITTKVTGRGQVYFINLLLKKQEQEAEAAK